MAKPILYHALECHECGLVRRLLRSHAVAFESVVIPAGDRSLVRAKFGTESVPVLVHGPFRSNDLQSICRHIASTFGSR